MNHRATTIFAIVAVFAGSLLIASAATGKTKPKDLPEPVAAPALPTPEQIRALNEAGFDIEIIHQDGGATNLEESASSKGVGASLFGDGLKFEQDAGAPVVGLGGDVGADGGRNRTKGSASAFVPPQSTIGVFVAGLLIAGAGAYLYFRVPIWKRVGLGMMAGGFGLAAFSYYPALTLMGMGVCAVLILWPMIQSQIKSYEALRAYDGAITHPAVAKVPGAAAAIANAMAVESDGTDRSVISAVRAADADKQHAPLIEAGSP